MPTFSRSVEVDRPLADVWEIWTDVRIGLGVSQRLTERVTALSPDRTRLTIDVEYKLPFGPLGRLASKLGVEQLARRETTEILERLKEVVESTLPAR